MSGTAARTVSIRLTADNAEPTRRALEQVGESGERALRRIDGASVRAQPAMQGLAAASDGAARAFANLDVGLGGAERAFAGIATGARGAAAGVAALAAGTVAAGVAIARAGDSATESLARLQAATGSIAAASTAYEGLYRLSQQTGVAVSESAGAFARFAIAAREVGATNDQVLALVRTVQQAGIVAGASTAETSATVMQLGQALASGRLQGDELRSILENMPTLAEAFARELGVGVGELRKMGEEGKLTADVVMPALLRAGERINAEFEKLPPTMGRSFSILGEAMTRFAGDLDRALGLSQAIARAAAAAASAVNSGRLAVGLGNEQEQAAAGYDSARGRVAALDGQISSLQQSMQGAMPGGSRRLAAGNLSRLQQEREAALADLARFTAQRNLIEQQSQEAAAAEELSADAKRNSNARKRADEQLAELRAKFDKERGIRTEHSAVVERIEAQLNRGAIDGAEAQRLRTAADRERDEALAKLQDRTERNTRASERLSEAEREQQRLVERGASLVASAATEAEKYADQVRALDAAQAAGRITQEQYNRAFEQLNPAAKDARESLAKTQQEAERFAEQSRDALSRIGENALDRLGQGLVNAFTQGGKAALDFGSLARSIFSSVATDVGKLALVNPLANAVFGTTRPTLNGAMSGGGSLSGLFGFSSRLDNLGVSSGLFGNGVTPDMQGPTPSGQPLGATSQSGLFGTTTASSALGGIAGGIGLGLTAGSLVGGIRGTANPMIGSGIGSVAGAGLGFLVGGPMGAMIGGALGGAAGGLFGPTRKGMASRSGGDVFYSVDDAGRLVITDARGKRWDQSAATAEVQAALDQANQGASSRGLTFSGISGAWGFGQASRSARGLDDAALLRALRSDNANISTALGTLAGRGAGLSEGLAAADFVRQSFEPLVRLAGPLDQVAAAIQKVHEQFDETTQRAQALGLATQQLTAARDREIAKITLQRDASALGTIASQQNTLLGFLNGIASQGLSPQAALTEAQTQFGSALDAARSAGLGRADLSRVVSAGRTLLDAGRSFYASGPGAAELQQFVTASISNLGAQFDLPAFGGSLDAAVEKITGLTDEVALLRDEVSRLRDELRSARLLRAA